MTPRELRIGNFVRNREGSQKEWVVDSLSQRAAVLLSFWGPGQTREQITFKYHNLEGIPLTAEWLERFGFKQNDNSDNWWNKEKDCSVDAEPTLSDNGVQYLFYYRLCEDRRRKSLVYVHQLQNLYFALTGEELTLREP